MSAKNAAQASRGAITKVLWVSSTYKYHPHHAQHAASWRCVEPRTCRTLLTFNHAVSTHTFPTTLWPLSAILMLVLWVRHRGLRPSLPFVAGALSGKFDPPSRVSLPSETELNCPHFKECPGCAVDRDYLHTPSARDAQAFFAPHVQVPVRVVVGPIHEWRTVAKLAVRSARTVGGGRGCGVGLFRAGSHDLLEVPGCRVHHPAINAAAEALRRAAEAEAIEPYDEATFRGALRYVLLHVERGTGATQLTLVWNAGDRTVADGSGLTRLAGRLLQDRSVRLKSVWANLNTGRGNGIVDFRATRWFHLAGDPCLSETVGAATFPFPPTIFRQANLDAFERIIDRVVEWVPRGARVCELYAGVGIVGLNVLLRCGAEWVHCSDDNPNLVPSFEAAVRGLSPDVQGRARFRPLKAIDALRTEAEGATVLIVDPPRKGLSAGEVMMLCAADALPSLQWIVYISCGLRALQRDTTALLGSGRWRVAFAEAHLLFPGSDHVETLAVFDRTPAAVGTDTPPPPSTTLSESHRGD
jgi:23S rRNA (uracil1939-C5)-methyltransferase